MWSKEGGEGCFQADICGKTILDRNGGRHKFGGAMYLSTNRCAGLQNTVYEKGWDKKHRVL